MGLANETVSPESNSRIFHLIAICQDLKENNPDEKTLQALADNQALKDHTKAIVLHLQTELKKCCHFSLGTLTRWAHQSPVGFFSFYLVRLSNCTRFARLHTPGHSSCALQQIEQELSRFLRGVLLLVLNGLESLYLEV